MTVFKIATASVVLCCGLLFTSFLMAAEEFVLQPYAQMNRVGYQRPAALMSRPVAQMNRAGHPARAALPRQPGARVNLVVYALLTGTVVPTRVYAQMNRALYDR